MDKNYRANASQFFVAGELCRRGLVAVVTMGNCPTTDILCSNAEGTKFVHIQVKTFRPGDETCSVGEKAEKDYGENFYWILSGIPMAKQKDKFQYYVIPAKEMAENTKESHKIWKDTPGRNGRQHDQHTKFRTVDLPPIRSSKRHPWKIWDVSKYLNKWDLIENKLK